MIKCPACGSTESKVTNSRGNPAGKWRRRQCLACGEKYSTVESVIRAAGGKEPLRKGGSAVDRG